MRASVHVYDLAADEVVGLAREIESRGLDGIWLGEHIVIPARQKSVHPGRSAQTSAAHSPILEHDTQLQDPWVTVGAIAATTSRIEIGLGVYILPLRHPLITARAAASAHDTSQGRFRLGIGSGWLAEEFDALGVPFGGRGARVDEILDILDKAWQGGPFQHDGPLYCIPEVVVTPHPTPIPVIIGGNSPSAMRRAARRGDGWISSGTPGLELADYLAHQLDSCRRDPGTCRPFRQLVRVPGHNVDVIRQHLDHGFDDLLFHVDRTVAARLGGWRAWLDEVCGAIDGYGGKALL